MNVRSTRAKAVIVSTGLLIASAVTAPHVAAAPQGTASTYLVLYRDGASSTDAASTVSGAGGTLVANYGQIGVVVARSSNATSPLPYSKTARSAALRVRTAWEPNSAT